MKFITATKAFGDLAGQVLFINVDHVQMFSTVESKINGVLTQYTEILLSSGKYYEIKESADEIFRQFPEGTLG